MENLILNIVILIFVLIATIFLFLIYKKLNLFNPSQLFDELSGKFNEFHKESDELIEKEFQKSREENQTNSKLTREEISGSFKLLGEQLSERIKEIAERQKDQLEIIEERMDKLTKTNEEKFEKLKEQVSAQLSDIQESNEKKLEEMRRTVDEKLHETLEKRLGESFKQVSERLELVHKGLGEMQTLASGVGDLKKVLTNVKTRGTWGEVQLGNLIEQILAPNQYEKNVKTKKGSSEIVEFAVKLPGRTGDENEIVWLPIDAKFPMEDYQRLLAAQDAADPVEVEKASKEIEKKIRAEAANIATKYLDPPNTTDFAIMFLPVEGLYAEVLRIPGLAERIQRESRVIITGPTNLAALLNSLQMGFRTLAIEKRSSEVWKLLGIVKTEFRKFGDILEKTKQKIEQASNTLGEAARKSRTIERKLRNVEELPAKDDQLGLLE